MATTYTSEVVLHDKDGRGHKLRLLRAANGDIYAECSAKHGGHEVFSALNLGPAWALIPQLAPLR
jgi:hypothetical protein